MQCSGITTLDFTYLPCSGNSITSKTVFLLQKKSHYQIEKKLLKSEAVHSLLLPENKFFFSKSIFEYTYPPCKKFSHNVSQYKH